MLSSSVTIILEKYSIKDCHQKVKDISQDLDVIIITFDIDPDKTVEMFIRAEKENVPDFITAFSDNLRQAGNA